MSEPRALPTVDLGNAEPLPTMPVVPTVPTVYAGAAQVGAGDPRQSPVPPVRSDLSRSPSQNLAHAKAAEEALLWAMSRNSSPTRAASESASLTRLPLQGRSSLGRSSSPLQGRSPPFRQSSPTRTASDSTSLTQLPLQGLSPPFRQISPTRAASDTTSMTTLPLQSPPFRQSSPTRASSESISAAHMPFQVDQPPGAMGSRALEKAMMAVVPLVSKQEVLPEAQMIDPNSGVQLGRVVNEMPVVTFPSPDERERNVKTELESITKDFIDDFEADTTQLPKSVRDRIMKDRFAETVKARIREKVRNLTTSVLDEHLPQADARQVIQQSRTDASVASTVATGIPSQAVEEVFLRSVPSTHRSTGSRERDSPRQDEAKKGQRRTPLVKLPCEQKLVHTPRDFSTERGRGAAKPSGGAQVEQEVVQESVSAAVPEAVQESISAAVPEAVQRGTPSGSYRYPIPDTMSRQSSGMFQESMAEAKSQLTFTTVPVVSHDALHTPPASFTALSIPSDLQSASQPSMRGGDSRSRSASASASGSAVAAASASASASVQWSVSASSASRPPTAVVSNMALALQTGVSQIAPPPSAGPSFNSAMFGSYSSPRHSGGNAQPSSYTASRPPQGGGSARGAKSIVSSFISSTMDSFSADNRTPSFRDAPDSSRRVDTAGEIAAPRPSPYDMSSLYSPECRDVMPRLPSPGCYPLPPTGSLTPPEEGYSRPGSNQVLLGDDAAAWGSRGNVGIDPLQQTPDWGYVHPGMNRSLEPAATKYIG